MSENSDPDHKDDEKSKDQAKPKRSAPKPVGARFKRRGHEVMK